MGSLVAIVGGTGEGKTSLVSAMLGELPPVGNASVIIRGTVAYVPQVSWIFNATVRPENASFFFPPFYQNLFNMHDCNVKCQVRDNILFGSNFKPERYWKAVSVTAMEHDLDLLPVELAF